MPPHPRPSCWRASTTRPPRWRRDGQPAEVLDRAVARLAAVDRALQGVAGVLALAGHADLDAAISARLDGLDAAVGAARGRLETPDDDEPADDEPVDGVEELNAALVAAARRRSGPSATTGSARREPSPTWPGRDAPPSALAGFTAVQLALSALDRLEVRGRDSAGLHLLVCGPRPRPGARRAWPGCWPAGPTTPCSPRAAVRVADGNLAFVYKAAAEIGELGDNTAALRAAIARRRAAAPRARVADGPGDRARPHPLGQRRHHLRGQRPPAQPRGGGRVGRARTWRPCSTATSTTTPT